MEAMKVNHHYNKNYNNLTVEDTKHHIYNSFNNDHKIPHEHSFTKNIKFSYIVDQDTGKIRIKVYDYMTGETIQEIPSDKFLEFLKELKKGLDHEILVKQGFLPEGIFIEDSV